MGPGRSYTKLHCHGKASAIGQRIFKGKRDLDEGSMDKMSSQTSLSIETLDDTLGLWIVLCPLISI